MKTEEKQKEEEGTGEGEVEGEEIERPGTLQLQFKVLHT